MKTKQIPAIVMLIAGFAMCIISYVNDFSLSFLIRAMLLTLVGFYILGYIIKVIFDMNMSQLDEKGITADDLGFADGEIIEDVELIDDGEQES